MTDLIISILTFIFGSKTARRMAKRMLTNTRYAFNHVFYPQPFIQSLLRDCIDDPLPASRFLDYSVVLRNGYYKDDTLSLPVRIGNRVENYSFPYSEVINFINSDATIEIDSSRLTDTFVIPEELKRATQNAFDTFCASRMLTSDDATLRVESLRQEASGRWTCHLQHARYTDQVRTNLTLDFPMDSVVEETMRTKDLGPGNSLQPFDKSLLANTIGVSGIWIMRKKSRKAGRGQNLYFLMPRRRNTGVYNGMLGTVSGVAKAPQEGVFTETSLEDYLAGEMRRELFEESGIDTLVAAGTLDPKSIVIKPLAFVRDLNRGGKPQFFFLISTDYIPPAEIAKAFRASFNGRMEFDNGVHTRFPAYKLSPETLLNMLYALRYVQQRKNLPFIDLDD